MGVCSWGSSGSGVRTWPLRPIPQLPSLSVEKPVSLPTAPGVLPAPWGRRGQTDETTALKCVPPGAPLAQARTQPPSGKSPRTPLRSFVAEILEQKSVEWLLVTPAALRQSLLLSLSLSLLSTSSRLMPPSDTAGTPSVLAWQALPWEPDVPWEGRGHPRAVSDPLLKPSALPASTLGSAQSQGQAGPLGFQCCPLTAPELCRQLGASWSQQTQSSGWCTGDPGNCAKCLQGWVPLGEPLPGLAPCCCAGLVGNHEAARLQKPPRQLEATRLPSPCALHLVPAAGLGQKTPLEPVVSTCRHGQPEPVRPLPTLRT